MIAYLLRVFVLLLAACGDPGLPDGAMCTTHDQCASRRCKERGHCLGKAGGTIECTDDDGVCADPFAGCRYELKCEAR